MWGEYTPCFGDEENKNGFIVNDCGNRDWLPVIGKFAGWRYGYAGTYGFGGTYVLDRYHDGGHDLFFDRGFIQKYWKPFILDGVVVPGTAEKGEGIPWYIRLLYWQPLNLQIYLLIMLMLAVVLFFATRWYMAVPSKADIPFPAFVGQFNNAKSKGEIALDGFIGRYGGHQVTWNCFILEVKASERSYKIGATQEAHRSDQVLAVFTDEQEFNSYLREGEAVEIEGILLVTPFGAILNECEFVSDGS